MGYSPRGRKESDMTEATEHTRKAELKESVLLPLYRGTNQGLAKKKGRAQGHKTREWPGQVRIYKSKWPRSKLTNSSPSLDYLGRKSIGPLFKSIFGIRHPKRMSVPGPQLFI